MKLTESQIQALKDRFDNPEFWKDPKCPACNSADWAANDTIFQLPEFHQGGILLGGLTFPILPVTCNKCGYVLLFNAMILGIISLPKSLSTAETEKGGKS
jgi:aconitase B